MTITIPPPTMALSSRLFGPILTDVSFVTLFAGVDEQRERMKALRSKITDVRRMWQDNDEYEALKLKIRECVVDHGKLSAKTVSRITTLLSGYSDWADMDYHRPSPEEQQRSFTAIELYCSEDGYDFMFGIFNAVLREKDIPDDNVLLVTAAAALVEFVTIELYNLRLSNIGDPKYENFQGVTFRKMPVSKATAAAYRKAASNPDLSKRRFGVPLGFISSSSNEATIADFAERYPGQDQMQWVIHIQGLDPRLLEKYEQRYPDSVVTSIAAMPVGRMAGLRQQEILLRGAPFHIVRMESREVDGVTCHTLQLVMMNANRDHGTQLALDDGAKAAQRIFYRDMITASRFQSCAQLARTFSIADSKEYERLAKNVLDRISASEFMAHGFSIDLFPQAGTVSESRATWYGDKLGCSFPSSYLELRKSFHKAAEKGEWNVVRDVIRGDYEWQVEEWFNVQAVGLPWRGRTLLVCISIFHCVFFFFLSFPLRGVSGWWVKAINDFQ